MLSVMAVNISYAQFSRGYQMPVVAGDTIVNTGSVTKTFTATGGYSKVSVQINVQKVSGTPAGNVVLYGSLDGVNYTSLGDTLKLSNVTTVQTATFAIDGAPYVYYQVSGTGTGTMVAGVSVWYLLRKYLTVY